MARAHRAIPPSERPDTAPSRAPPRAPTTLVARNAVKATATTPSQMKSLNTHDAGFALVGAADTAKALSATIRRHNKIPSRFDGRWWVTTEVMRTTTPMLLAAMACTANSGRRCRAISENTQATTLRAMPARYPTLTVTRNADRLPLRPLIGVRLAARSSTTALMP
jgi:hypothetical protein